MSSILLLVAAASLGVDYGYQPIAGGEEVEHILQIEQPLARALAQLGIDVKRTLEETPGLTWVSLTGYGRREPYSNWVAFGDDAGAAAGLAATTGGSEAPLFCGDALPDPLTGLHAALAALAGWQSGGGVLRALSLHDVAAHTLCFRTEASSSIPAKVERCSTGWAVIAGSVRTEVEQPRARRAPVSANILGADTQAVLNALGIPC